MDLLAAEARAARAWRVDGAAAAAAAAMADAVAAADAVPYLEPPRWYYSPRQCLGQLLLLARNASHALQVFADDLQALPENAWSLGGASKAAAAVGEADAAKEFAERAAVAWQFADTPLVSACPQFTA